MSFLFCHNIKRSAVTILFLALGISASISVRAQDSEVTAEPAPAGEECLTQEVFNGLTEKMKILENEKESLRSKLSGTKPGQAGCDLPIEITQKTGRRIRFLENKLSIVEEENKNLAHKLACLLDPEPPKDCPPMPEGFKRGEVTEDDFVRLSTDMVQAELEDTDAKSNKDSAKNESDPDLMGPPAPEEKQEAPAEEKPPQEKKPAEVSINPFPENVQQEPQTAESIDQKMSKLLARAGYEAEQPLAKISKNADGEAYSWKTQDAQGQAWQMVFPNPQKFDGFVQTQIIRAMKQCDGLFKGKVVPGVGDDLKTINAVGYRMLCTKDDQVKVQSYLMSLDQSVVTVITKMEADPKTAEDEQFLQKITKALAENEISPPAKTAE